MNIKLFLSVLLLTSAQAANISPRGLLWSNDEEFYNNYCTGIWHALFFFWCINSPLSSTAPAAVPCENTATVTTTSPPPVSTPTITIMQTTTTWSTMTPEEEPQNPSSNVTLEIFPPLLEYLQVRVRDVKEVQMKEVLDDAAGVIKTLLQHEGENAPEEHEINNKSSAILRALVSLILDAAFFNAKDIFPSLFNSLTQVLVEDSSPIFENMIAEILKRSSMP